MSDTVRKAAMADFPRILEIYAIAREEMARNGNPTQWGTTWPEEDVLRADIRKGQLYVICREEKVCGVFCLLFGEDPTYQRIEGAWHSGKPYATIHRLAGQGGGIFAACVEFAATLSDYLRVDTHEKNTAMRRAIDKQGFSFCGIIYVEDGSPRRAYDRLVGEKSC